MTNLLCGPKVGGFQDPCDLGFPRLDAFGAEQSLLTYFADLSGPALRYGDRHGFESSEMVSDRHAT